MCREWVGRKGGGVEGTCGDGVEKERTGCGLGKGVCEKGRGVGNVWDWVEKERTGCGL